MAQSVVEPKGKGALLLDSHPAGCERSVVVAAEQARQAQAAAGSAAAGRPPTVLVIGSSAGYGQAITIAGLVGLRMSGLALCLERAATGRRSASAGWYRTRAMATLARDQGADFEFHNGDCYAAGTKEMVLDRLTERYGPVDYLIYSVASPRRTDATGTTHQSVIKPVGEATSTFSVDLDAGDGSIRSVEVAPASHDEIVATTKVMGGEDWADWVGALAGRDLLAPGCTTVALSYLGSGLTAPIYRQGTIGRAKDHLELTARELTESTLKSSGARAITSVNGAAVTQASSAIPGISLYVSLLHSVLGERMQSPTIQGLRLWQHLSGAAPAAVDPQGRIRLDDWEFAAGVQDEVAIRWEQAVLAGRLTPAEASWFTDEIHRLYGFAVPGVDYAEPRELDLPWPAVFA